MKALDIKKKPYETPQVKAYQVKVESIIATSEGTASQNEEYETGDTSTWF